MCLLIHGLYRTKHTATMTDSRRLKRARKRVTVSYDDDPSMNEPCRDITIMQSSTGRLLHSTTLANAGASEFADPWTQGFFDKNSEAFVVDSLPDELPGFDTPDLLLDSNEEIKDPPKVPTIF